MKERCSLEDCDKPVQARGWCPTHYTRWRRTGTTSGGLATPIERFWSRVKRGAADECWPWTGVPSRAGYGTFIVGKRGRRQNAHRWIWEQINGPASSKLHLDHLCRNKLCVNPTHMELVTHAENLRRGKHTSYQAMKTHCKRGHPFDEANTYVKKTGRACKACSRMHVRDYRQKIRQAG